MTLQAKILIVDDDYRLRSLLKCFLSDEGFLVDCVASAEQMTENIKRSYYDLIVLDWMLPGEDGLSVCSRLTVEEENSPPIIMLTANASESHCVACLKCGADDYLAKPFNPDVLVARIHAVLRRSPRVVESLTETKPSLFHFGPFVLDFTQHCLFHKDSKLDISSGEFALLKILAESVGKSVSREQLGFLIKGQNYKPEDRFVDVQIYRLRRLVETDPVNPVYLKTVRGVGYMLLQQSDNQYLYSLDYE